jgi:hypothetical protein
LGILEVAQKFELDIAIKQAMNFLSSTEVQNLLSPCARLRIAWEFQLEAFYDEAVHAVLNIRPFTSFTFNDIIDLESQLLSEILQIYHDAATTHLKLLGYLPNLIHVQTVCTSKQAQHACELHWREAYSSYIHLLGNTE